MCKSILTGLIIFRNILQQSNDSRKNYSVKKLSKVSIDERVEYESYDIRINKQQTEVTNCFDIC